MEMKGYEMLAQGNNMMTFGVGALVAFIVAMVAIKTFISFLQKHGFKWFGIYRILAGLAMLGILWWK